MDKKKKQPGKLRLLIQCAFAALSNGHLIGFQTGKIYTGPLKTLCTPGMNCYSCPGALGACPIGALQAVLSSKQYHVALYVFGLLTVMGTVFGRLICGFLCPFGLIQDLLHKIPFPKKNPQAARRTVLALAAICDAGGICYIPANDRT